MVSASQKVIRRRRSWPEKSRWITISGEPKTAADARFVAISGAAALERNLENAIRFKLGRLSKKQVGELFDDPGPLSTFSAKVKIGHAMRLYGIRTKSDLNHVREIRNMFAHAERPITFKTRRIRDLCLALHAPSRLSKLKPVSFDLLDNAEYRQPPYSRYRLTLDMLTIEMAILSDPKRTRRYRHRKATLP